MDAGLVYNSYPLMAGRFLPQDWLALTPKIRNFTENPSTVQFDHRTLVIGKIKFFSRNQITFIFKTSQGHFTVLLLSSVWLLSRRIVLPPRARYAANALAAMAWMQVHITNIVACVFQQ